MGGNATTLTAIGTNFTINELRPYTVYNFSVAASTRIGRGPFDVVTAQTPQSSKS